MWEQGGAAGFGGGGFMSGAVDSPAGGEKQGKGRRTQNIMPVSIKQLLDWQEEGFKIEGFEAHTITIVGLVKEVETSTTKMCMYLEDQTGTIECVNYVGTDGDGSNDMTVLCEGTYGRIVGGLRTTKGQKYMIIFKAEPVEDLNELTMHLLEVVHCQMKLKKLRAEEENKPIGGDLDNTFSNSMIKGGLGGSDATMGGGGGGIQGLTANQNMVHRIISSARDEAGMHKDQIISAIKNRIPLHEIEKILDFLSNEGHVFSTVDDDHYKTTDSQYM